MPKNLTKFNPNWFSRVDPNNDSVKIWLKSGSTSTTFKCSLCQTTDLNCGNQGWKAVEQHMNNSKHQHLLNQWKTNTKFTVSNQSTSSSSIAILDINNNKNKDLSLEDQTIKAEIIWTLNVAQKGFSYSSCDELHDLFSSMFNDSVIAKNFCMQSDKISYVISHGLGPYFKKKMLEDVKIAERFVLVFDEQTNNQNKKQLDMLIRYWSNENNVLLIDFINQ